MILTQTANFILATLLTYAGAGKSEYSMQAVPECGTDSTNPLCNLEPRCELSLGIHCLPPHWSISRNAWVVPETKEEAAKRYTNAAIALDATLTKMETCLVNRVPDELCTPVRFPNGKNRFMHLVLTASYWESGYREDIMVGAKPKGRGAGGEACLMQVMPWLIRDNADWLTPEQRKDLTDEQLALMTLGTDIESLKRCYQAGANLLLRVHKTVPTRCKSSEPISATFALYGTGSSCHTIENPLSDFANLRTDWYYRSLNRQKIGLPYPEWFQI